MEKTIYQQMIDAGVKCEFHASDLYVPVNSVTSGIIHNYRFKNNVTTFISQIDNKLWYDIPFAYDPHWVNK
jgi:hypothetical protein